MADTAVNFCTLKCCFLRPSRFVPPRLARPFAVSGADPQKGVPAREVRRSLNTAGKHCSACWLVQVSHRHRFWVVRKVCLAFPFGHFSRGWSAHVFLLGQSYQPNEDGRRVWLIGRSSIRQRWAHLTNVFAEQLSRWQNKRPPNKAFTLTTSTRFICLIKMVVVEGIAPAPFLVFARGR